MLYSFFVDFVKLMAVTVHEILRKIPVSRRKNGNNNFVIKTTKSRTTEEKSSSWLGRKMVQSGDFDKF